MLIVYRAICSLPIEPYAHCLSSHMLIAHRAICSLPIEPYAHCLSSHMLLFPPEYIFLIFSDLASRFPAFINCNSRHLAGSHPKKVDCQAKVVPSLFTGYGPLDRQESGRILCQDRICHHHSQSRLVSDTLSETLPFLECILRLKSNFTLIPQHFDLTLFISSWATKSCSGFCHVRFFTYLSVANQNKRKS